MAEHTVDAPVTSHLDSSAECISSCNKSSQELFGYLLDKQIEKKDSQVYINLFRDSNSFYFQTFSELWDGLIPYLKIICRVLSASTKDKQVPSTGMIMTSM